MPSCGLTTVRKPSKFPSPDTPLIAGYRGRWLPFPHKVCVWNTPPWLRAQHEPLPSRSRPYGRCFPLWKRVGTPELQPSRGLGKAWTPTGELPVSSGLPSPGPAFPGGRGAGGSGVGSSPGRGAGKGHFLLRRGGEGARKEKEGWGRCKNSLVSRLPSGTRQASARPGRQVTRAPASWGQQGGRCRRSLGSRPDARCPPGAPSPPRLASPRGRRPGWRGDRGRRPGPQGRQAAPLSRGSGRRRQAPWSARPGARAPTIGLGAPASPPGPPTPVLRDTPPLPPPPTCTARLRKVPASAANFLTLKSIMFILRGSRAELPADLAGRRRRRGRAGAPGGSGGGRRGERREAAPALRPQLSFPSRGEREGGARGRARAPPSGPRVRAPQAGTQGLSLPERRRRRTRWRAGRGGRAGNGLAYWPPGQAPQRRKRAVPRGGAFVEVIAGTATPSGPSRRCRGARRELGSLRPREGRRRWEGRAAGSQHRCTVVVSPREPRADNSDPSFYLEKKNMDVGA